MPTGATFVPSRGESSLIQPIHFRLASQSPCEQLRRATFMPASMRAFTVSRESVAGPRVQTIFVRRFIGASLSSRRLGGVLESLF